MDVFISWSGDKSKHVATTLHRYIPRIIQAVKPFMSAHDIESGSRGIAEISAQLEKSNFGIICLSADNLDAPWILFEAGALSKHVQASRVCTYLIENKPSDIEKPLGEFQASEMTEDGTLRVLQSINSKLENGKLADDELKNIFGKWWDEIRSELEKAHKLSAPKVPVRTDREIAEDTLNDVRASLREVQGLNKTLELMFQLIVAGLNSTYKRSSTWELNTALKDFRSDCWSDTSGFGNTITLLKWLSQFNKLATQPVKEADPEQKDKQVPPT